MPRTPKPTWAPLPEFAGTGSTRDRALPDRLEAYVVKAYRQGMSIRDIAQLVDRASTTVHGVLKAHHQAGQLPIASAPSTTHPLRALARARALQERAREHRAAVALLRRSSQQNI